MADKYHSLRAVSRLRLLGLSGALAIACSPLHAQFETRLSKPTLLSPNSVAVGDFNRDNNTDIAIAASQSGQVSVFLGNGNGTFGTALNYGAGTSLSGTGG